MKEEFDLIKNLISEKGVKNRTELSRKYSGMYNKFFKNLSKEEKDLLLPSTYPSYGHLNTKDDFKNGQLKKKIDNITVNASPTASTSTVKGTGKFDLKKDVTVLEIIVTSAAGTTGLMK